ncbi:MAG: 23S rRNA (guanosine(2251)-2'-O)-methyltransferase RlmB [Thermoanaerobaculia bacterium]
MDPVSFDVADAPEEVPWKAAGSEQPLFREGRAPAAAARVRRVRVYGFHPVREALRHRPREVARVLVASGRGGGRRQEVEALCRRAGVPYEAVPRNRLDELAAGAPHNGFLAELPEAGVEGVGQGPAGESGRGPGAGTGQAAAGRDPDLVVLLEDVQDPGNLGALLRVCEGAGVGRVLVRHRGSAPLSPAVVKASAGAAEWLPVERVTNSADTIRRLKAEGFWVYGAAAGGRPPWEIDLGGKIALVLGGEEKGLRRLTRELCDELAGLPMRGRVESLNVATAAAALLYEAVRQRG